MSYLGRTQNKSSDIRRFDVTSSTSATHTLTWTPPNELSLIVTINGVKQHEDAYSVSGVTLTLTSALVAEDKLEVIGISDIGTTITPAQSSVVADHIVDGVITSAKIADGTIVNADINASAAITQSKLVNIVDADIDASAAIGAGKLASTLNLASKTVTLPAASVTTHVTAFDDTPVRRDIATLALHTAISDNKAAYNLSNAFIDQYEDSTGIHTTSTATRNIDEFVQTGSSTTESLGYGDSITITYTVAVGGLGVGAWQAAMEDNATGAYAAYGDAQASNVIARMDMGQGVTLTEADFYSVNTNGRFASGYWEHSDTDGGTYTAVTPTSMTSGSDSNSGTLMTFGNQSEWKGLNFTGITKRYWQWRMVSAHNNGNNYCGFGEVRWPNSTYSTLAAAGNYTSTTQTALASVSTMGIVVLYKNESGTATLNTDLIAQVSANGGTNYANATLVAGGTFSTGINIAAVSGVSVTAGTTPKYKISFANQSVGSKETRIYGVALLY